MPEWQSMESVPKNDWKWDGKGEPKWNGYEVTSLFIRRDHKER